MNKKEYKSVDELMVILRDKGLSFKQPNRAKRLLTENNYYSVTAYKTLFYKDNTRCYIPGTDFEHLFAVYAFDKSLKTVVLKHLLFIEQKIKTALSNQISFKYGIDEKEYLKKSNFDNTSPFLDENLNKVKEQIKKFGSKNVSVVHFSSKHKIIPFWVLSKCLTMGVIRDLLYILKPSDQDVIFKGLLEKGFNSHSPKKAKAMISLFADIRNMCAHDEKLAGYVHQRITIPILPEHTAVSCKKDSDGNIIQGRGDLLALVISIKYFLNKTDYNEFIQDITSCITKCYRKISDVISYDCFLNYIGLPIDFDVLKKF